jgi:DNA mismatch repair protein MutL
MTIRVLSPEVASQISAGEVIERPASVVKELLENALDAGASSISVTIQEAGKRLIEVTDDGFGILAEELGLSVTRHATSKLVAAHELFHITSLGFRGEALASIASVSRLILTSRVEQSKTAARLKVDGGKTGRVESTGAPRGTVVSVQDLFYNVPARLKFLKSDSTERRVIDSLVTRYALAYPNVRFKYADDGNMILQTTGDGDRRAILSVLYGADSARQMLDVFAEEAPIKLHGFISPLSLTRSNRRDISFFVNGRWVQDIPLTTALVQAYHTLLMVGRYPLASLFLEIAPEQVDVNVHPSKSEIRFREADKVFSFVQRAARRALLAYSPVPQVSQPTWGQTWARTDPGWDMAHADQQHLDGHAQISSYEPPASLSSVQGTGASPAQGEFAKIPLLRLIGQVGATYLVAEGPDGLYLIDQHAAHERILFEKLLDQHASIKSASQALLTPAILDLTGPQASLLLENLEALGHLGFVIEEFGPASFQIRAVPAFFNSSNAIAAIRAVVEDFEEDETPLKHEIELRLAGRVCKGMAVKGGQVLSMEEQKNLLSDLEECKSPRTCPHGRPTMIHLSVDLLEKQFGRRGPR